MKCSGHEDVRDNRVEKNDAGFPIGNRYVKYRMESDRNHDTLHR